MKPKIPEAFRLVAKTEWAGGSAVRAYWSPDDSVIMTIQSFRNQADELGKIRPVEHWSVLGPIPRPLLEPVMITVKDVKEMTYPTFIEE